MLRRGMKQNKSFKFVHIMRADRKDLHSEIVYRSSLRFLWIAYIRTETRMHGAIMVTTVPLVISFLEQTQKSILFPACAVRTVPTDRNISNLLDILSILSPQLATNSCEPPRNTIHPLLAAVTTITEAVTTTAAAVPTTVAAGVVVDL